MRHKNQITAMTHIFLRYWAKVLFKINKLHLPKKSANEGKSPRPINIEPKVLKKYNFVEIMPYFANKLLMENIKPK